MYLRNVAIRNFSIHKETRITLSPITVLVGPNGGGKSAFFDALLNFSMLSRGKLGEAFGPYPYSFTATRHRGASAISRIGYEVLMAANPESAEELRYKIDYSQAGERTEEGAPRLEIHKESLEELPAGRILFDREDPDASPLSAAISYLADDIGIFAAIRRAELAAPGSGFPDLVLNCAREISRFNKFRLNSYNLSSPSALPDVTTTTQVPRLDYKGENLAGTLYHMKETNSEALETIVSNLRMCWQRSETDPGQRLESDPPQRGSVLPNECI